MALPPVEKMSTDKVIPEPASSAVSKRPSPAKIPVVGPMTNLNMLTSSTVPHFTRCSEARIIELRGRIWNFFRNFQPHKGQLKKKNNSGRFTAGFPPGILSGMLLLLMVWLWALPVTGQITPDSNSIRHESLRQGINTVSFGQGLDFRKYFQNNKLRTVVKAGQFAIYNRAIPKNPFITNNVWTSILLNRQLAPYLIWQNEVAQQSFIANQTRIAQALSGMYLNFPAGKNSLLLISLRAGAINDKRLQFDNSGWKSDAMISWFRHAVDSGVTYRARAAWSYSQPGPRRNFHYLAEGGAEREFTGGGFMALDAQYMQYQVEDYLQKDIQSIKNDTLLGRFRIRIPISRNITFSSNNEYLAPNRSFFYLQLENRKENRNVRYFQDEYQSLNSLMYRNSGVQFTGTFETRYRSRTYDIINRLDPKNPLYLQELNQFNQRLDEERIKDIREQTTTYMMDMRIRLSARHTLRSSATGQLLRVDTRSEENNQDRDELLYSGDVVHDWNLPFGFRLSNKISGTYRHLIFIKASQSSENYADRIIRWDPSVRWMGKNLSWVGTMGIWATYQVRDFESQQDKNRSNRVLLFQHVIDYRIKPGMGLVAEVLRRENRLSQFSWKRFAESPIDTVIVHDLALRYRFSIRGISFQAGYRAFWQVRKSRASLADPGQGANLIYLKSYFVQQGPQIRFMRETQGRLMLQGELWMQWTSQFFNYSKSDLPYLSSPVSAEQLARSENRFLPFFNIQLIWLLSKPEKR
jgi:hypothetical protein